MDRGGSFRLESDWGAGGAGSGSGAGSGAGCGIGPGCGIGCCGSLTFWPTCMRFLGGDCRKQSPLSILRQKFCRHFSYDVVLAAAACSRTFTALPASATPRSNIVAFVLGSTPQYP